MSLFYIAAKMGAVYPYLSIRSSLAWYYISNKTISVWLDLQACINADLPSLSY
jgi:hypothetical protein